MSKLARQSKHSLSLRLSLSILAFTVIIFMITIGIIFFRSQHFVRQAATEQATQILNNTAQSIMGVMGQVEVATENSGWLVEHKLQPDSIMALSRRILELNPDVYVCIPRMKTDILRLSRREATTTITSTWTGTRNLSVKAKPVGWIPSTTILLAPPTT